MKRILTYLILALLLAACKNNTKNPENEMPALYPPPVSVKLDTEEGYHINPVTGDIIYPLINSNGDTVRTGVPVPATGKVLEASSIPPPFIVPAGKPEIIRAHQNVYKIQEKQTVIPVPENYPRRVTQLTDTLASVLLNSYGDTIHTGVPLKLSGKVVPCLQPEPVVALPPGIKENAIHDIKYLDVFHGMNSAFVTSILKDSRGNMWFGTDGGGVSRYDGGTFTNYTTKEGLSGNRVRYMLEDSRGNLWFGTNDGGLTMYDGINFTHYTEKEGFSGRDVRMIIEDSKGDLWFVVFSGTVSMNNGSTFTHFSEKEGFPEHFIFSILEDRSGNLWVGSYFGVTMYDGHTFKDYWNGLVPQGIITIFEDSYGRLWFGSYLSAVLSMYDGHSFTKFTMKDSINSKNVMSILEDSQGNLWFGSEGGLSRLYANTFTHFTEKEGLSQNHVRSILDDREGNLWIGTNGGGVNIYKEESFEYYAEETGLTGNHVSSILEDSKGNLWFGTFNGVSIYDGKTFTHLTDKEGLSSNLITTMLEDSRGNLWFGTLDHGVTMYDGRIFRHFLEDEPGGYDFNTIFEDSKGNLWFCTNNCVTRYDGNSRVRFTINEGLSHNSVRSILEDSGGKLWFATWGGGVSRYDGRTFTHFTEKEGLSGNKVTSIMEDSRGNLWFGTWGGGVSIFNGETFTYITEREGLSSNHVSTILADSLGNVWLSTLRGIDLVVLDTERPSVISSRLTDPGKKEMGETPGLYNPVIHSYNEQDLKITEFNSVNQQIHSYAFSDSKNRIWWGNNEGLTMLDMNKFQPPADTPFHVHLNRLDVNGQFLDYNNLPDSIAQKIEFDSVARFYNYPLNLKLPHKLNHLTFYLSAIDWAAPHKIKYSYIMEGLDNRWSNPSSEPIADYRNLPQGTFTFKVRAIGAAQKWSEPFEYSFKIHPPWWYSWWAYMIYGIIIILIILQYRRYLLRRAKLQSAVEIERIEKEKVLEIDQLKSRFFANISHEFRTPLTLILGPIEGLLKKKGEETVIKNDELGIIHRNAKRLQQLINQLLDLSKLETGKVRLEVSEGDLSEFVRRIVLSFLSLAESKSIKYEYNIPDNPGQVFFDRDKVEKIVTNLVSNAFKFTPVGGEIYVKLKYKTDGQENPEFAEISVRDTGKGIPADQIERIFDRFYQVSSSDSRQYEGTGIGLSLTKELIDIYTGEIRVESEPGKGSVFTVVLPVSREKFEEEEVFRPAREQPSFTQPQSEDIPEVITDVFERKESPAVEMDIEKPVILIVEDNPDLRKYISGNLDKDYTIIEAENGREGMELAIEKIPDLIITDLMMPEMDGIEMCNRVRNDQPTSHIPVVMLTARADKDSKLKGLTTGADDYLVKPFDADELVIRVKNLIEQRKKLREKYKKEFLADLTGYELPPPEDEFMVRVMNCMKKNLSESGFNVDRMGNELGLSRFQLYRKIFALTDQSPGELIRNTRLKMAARMFREGHKNISRVMYSVGFNTPAYFASNFREVFGLNPSEYIRKNKPSIN